MQHYCVVCRKKLPVTQMFDIDGDETDDPEMACHVIVQDGPHSFWTVEVSEGEVFAD